MNKIFITSLLTGLIFLLLACLEVNQYTISFESHGGTFIEAIKTDGKSVVLVSESPTKEGHNFDGWYYDDETFELPFDPNAFLIRTRTESFTLYAKWNLAEYVVNFEHNGGIGIEMLTVLYGTHISLPESNKEGYKFFGWFFDEIYDEPFDETITFTESFTLYAKWEEYISVETGFDLAGGQWRGDIIPSFDPSLTLIVTTLNDETGYTLTLLDQTQTQYRWFYKLFINYDDLQNCYKVVAIDQATASIDTLNIEGYDYVIAIHDNHENSSLKSTFIDLVSNLETIDMFVFFDQSLEDYETGELSVDLYQITASTLDYFIVLNQEDDLPIPYKVGYRFLGWSDGHDLLTVFPGYTSSEMSGGLVLTATWQSHTTIDFTTTMDTYFQNIIETHLILPLSYGVFAVSWQSSNTNIISHEGTFYRPYVVTQLTLYATISTDLFEETIPFLITVNGYKSLDAPIASSYIYRAYHLVDDNFFETLDIINCAFITADHNGNLFGATFLSNVSQHIIPRAREHGNWVILSIAPESAWTTIAASASLRNTFADNIVSMINTYGFDGVDIDWEFPKNDTESAQFTLLMQIVHTKVKANNPYHLVTAALGAGQWQPPRYDLQNSSQYIDYINMMAYSMTSSNGYYQNALFRSTTNHHIAYSAGRTLTSCSIAESIAIYRDIFNIPLNKIIVGVAFYGVKQGRSYDASTSSWSTWSRLNSVFYHTIISQYVNNPNYTVYYDETAQVPYIIKNDGTEFISYDNPTSILAKAEYIKLQGLGGMMYWEHGTDTTGELLQAVRTGLNK